MINLLKTLVIKIKEDTYKDTDEDYIYSYIEENIPITQRRNSKKINTIINEYIK